jgi:hypothetical protein
MDSSQSSDSVPSPPPPFQFTLRTLMLVITGAAILLGLHITMHQPTPRKPLWKYEGQLHKEIEKADRIVIRNTWYDAKKDQIICEITNPSKIKEIFDNLQFETDQFGEACGCLGYPEIDWYSGQNRMALISVVHGMAIEWEKFNGNATLTPKSADWLVQWLKQNGADADKMQ